MKLSELSFPVTLEAFMAFQEAGTNRELTDNEREVLVEWVPVYNLSYEDGRAGDKEALTESVDKMDEFISKREGSPALERILQSCRWWIVYAWEQGRREAVE